MTCRQARSLLDDLADQELAGQQATEVKNHLDRCPDCRSDFEDTLGLKEALRQKKTFEPPSAYWVDALNLVIAKSSDFDPDRLQYVPEDTFRASRNKLIRSLTALAASIAILVSTLFIGSAHDHRITRQDVRNTQLKVATSIIEILGESDPEAPNLIGERDRLSRGLLLLGPPGVLGRFAILAELSIAEQLDY